MRKRLGYLNISDSKTEYRINIYSKFTIITGFSGVGKTHLINTIAEAFRVYARSKDMFYQFYKFESNFIVNILDDSVIARFASSTQNWLEFLSSEFKRGSLLCIDEDFEDLYTFDFQNALMNFDGYFIICCRNNLKYMAYSVYDLYRLDLSVDGFYHTNYSIFNPREHSNINFSRFNVLCTEDSRSGYLFFKNFLSNVITSSGKSAVADLIKQLDHTVFCVDGLGFGSNFILVMSLLNEYPSNSIWVIDSFESLIVNSDWFRSLGYTLNLDASKSNLEKQVTEILRDILEQKHIRYTKSRLPECFVKDCCYKPYANAPKFRCGLFCPGNKFELILGKELVAQLVSAFGDARVNNDKIPALAGAGSQQLSSKGLLSDSKLEYEEIPDEDSKYEDSRDEATNSSLDIDLFTNVF